MTMSQPSDYHSYLLRMWRDNPQAAWQATLQSTATEQVHHFTSVEHTRAFLKAQMAGEGDDSQAGHTPPGGLEPGAPD